MRHLILVLLLLKCGFAFSASIADTLEKKLQYEFSKRAFYDDQKEDRIKGYKLALQQTAKQNLRAHGDLWLKLSGEYVSYNYDSAYVYIQKLYEVNLKENNPMHIAASKLDFAFIFLSAGKYKEALDIIGQIDVVKLDNKTKRRYYSVISRAYFDLATYHKDEVFSPGYHAEGIRYLDSAYVARAGSTYSQLFLSSYRDYQLGNNQAALRGFLELDRKYKAGKHQGAINSSLLSELYFRLNRPDIGKKHLIEAVISDLKTSTKETFAIFQLAELASKNGDYNHAYLYATEALKDAEFYGASQRQIQSSSILPLITAQKVNFIESQKQRLFIFLCSAGLLSLIVIVISVLLYKQLRYRKAREKIIQLNNLELERMNTQLKSFNDQIVDANRKFSEDAHIKEEYIGYFFNIVSGYILKLEKLKTVIEAKIIQNKTDQILSVINEVNIHKERESLFRTFDQIFLKIFPNFILAFNEMFAQADQIWPKEAGSLTIDLRIFALCRLGITDNDSIAGILQYSAKTVYVYKMRLKAKSIYSSTEFDEKLMQIQAVNMPPK